MGRYQRSILSLAAVTVLIATGLVTGLAGTADAAHVSCGQTLPNNVVTTLHADLGPCVGGAPGPGDAYGLLISDASSSSGTTVIDLGGHTISGDFTPGQLDCGILVSNSSGVTVKNGAIRGFNIGVCIEDGSGNTVGGPTASDGVSVTDNVQALDNGGGITVTGSSANTIKNNVVERNGTYGVKLIGNADSNVIDHNIVSGHQAQGIYVGTPRGEVGDPDNNTVTNNTVVGNGLGGILVDAVVPMASHDGSSGNLIEDNLVEGHGDHGIGLGRSTARCLNSTTCQSVQPTSNTVRDNTACANGAYGIAVYGSANTVTNNQAGDRFSKSHPGGAIGPCVPNGIAALSVSPALAAAPAGWDLFDNTVGCLPLSGNGWTNNSYTTKNQACIA